MNARTIEDIPLLPRPRHIERLDHTVNANLPIRTRYEPDELTRPDEYTLEITDGSIDIHARDVSAGRSAMSTLDQLRRGTKGQLRAVCIHDWADFEKRGFMLDVSRDRIPTMPEFRRLVPLLASLKFNHLQLYVEHTFAYPGHESVWEELDAITPDQVRELDALCVQHGIELAANQNCFGHLAGWLKHPKYAHLAETHDEYDFYGMRREGPFSLAPSDPEALDLIRGWIEVLSACHSSNRINIGCDETADVGSGKSAERVAREGYGAVYARHVSDVASICEDNGLSPMFWADVATVHPEALDLLPSTLTALVWGYEPESAFEDALLSLRERGFETWVCPGTSCWRTFAGRTRERRGNLKQAHAAALRGTCKGFLLTEWGDMGHQQVWPVTLRALADGAQIAWSGRLARHADVDGIAFKNMADGLSDWLDDLGDADLPIREAHDDLPKLLNASATFHELFPAHHSLPPRGTLQMWENAHDRIFELADALPPIRDEHLAREARHALTCSLFATQIAVMRRGGERIAWTDDLLDEHAALWRKRSREGRLASSLSHWERLKCDLRVRT